MSAGKIPDFENSSVPARLYVRIMAATKNTFAAPSRYITYFLAPFLASSVPLWATSGYVMIVSPS